MEQKTYEMLLDIAQKKFEDELKDDYYSPALEYEKKVHYKSKIQTLSEKGQWLFEFAKSNKDVFERVYFGGSTPDGEAKPMDTKDDNTWHWRLWNRLDEITFAEPNFPINVPEYVLSETLKALELEQASLIQKVITDDLKFKALRRFESSLQSKGVTAAHIDLYASIQNNLLATENMLNELNGTKEFVEQAAWNESHIISEDAEAGKAPENAAHRE